MGTSTRDPITGNTTPDPRPDFGVKPPKPNPDATTWIVDATTLTSVDQSEHSVVNPGDELYLGRVIFRSTPGRTASTTAHFQGDISRKTTIRNVHEGESHAIPDSMGRLSYGGVLLRDIVDIVKDGNSPELLGSIDVMFEDDNTPKGKITDLLMDLAVAVRDEVAPIVEPLDLLDLDECKVAEQFEDAVARIKSVVLPSAGKKLGLWLASLGNPDDLIGYRISLFAAVDPSLVALFDEKLEPLLDDGDGTAGALRARTYTQRFHGSKGSWDVTYKVSS